MLSTIKKSNKKGSNYETLEKSQLNDAIHLLNGGESDIIASRNIESIIKHIDDSFNNRFKDMQALVTEMIDAKHPTKQTAVKKSYADTTKENSKDLASPEKESTQNGTHAATSNEEIDKFERYKNIIIHGKEEQQDDTLYVETLLYKVLGRTLIPISIKRIGRLENDSKRPIKVTFNEVEDQKSVMMNLRNLKGNEDYKGISIREDYTILERKTIREFVNQAKDRNAKEVQNSRFLWKVFGTPRKELMIKRTLKKNTTDNSLVVIKKI